MSRQEVDDAVIEPEPAFGEGEPDGGRRERLAERVEEVHALGRVGSPPPLDRDVPVADHHEAVHLEVASVEAVEHRVYGSDRDADVARSGAQEWGRGGRVAHRGPP